MIIEILPIIYIFFSTVKSSNVIKTLNGPVSGKNINGLDHPVTGYFGIPFAKPPIGDLRFKAPQPLDKHAWNKTFEATKLAKACLQGLDRRGFESPINFNIPESEQSEDCLQLNMWVPKKSSGAVIIFIFGGGFRFGSPSLDLYDGSVLASKTKAIVVNLNYRLGIFGFSYMSCGTDVQGNMGLLDQQMGMKWVHDNIKNFGGDPKKITIWGSGAGGASVTAHLLSEDSHPYFKRVIAGSGAITNIWARHYHSFVDSGVRIVGLEHDCRGLHHEIYECLKKLDSKKLLVSNNKYAIKVNMPFTYGFNILDEDDVFFKGEISEKLQLRKMKPEVDILIGRTSNEGSYFLPTLRDRLSFGCKDENSQLFKYDDKTCEMNKDDSDKFKKALQKTLKINSTGLEHLNKLYFDNCTDYRKCALSLLSNIAFDCDIVNFARKSAFSTNGYIFSYILDITSSAYKWPQWTKSVHGIELEYLFGLPFRRPKLYNKKSLKDEKKISEKMMKIMKNFAETGNPGYRWPKFNPYNIQNAKLDFKMIKKNYLSTVQESIFEKCKVIDQYVRKSFIRK